MPRSKYPRPGGYTIAGQVVGDLSLRSPLPDLEEFLRSARAVRQRLALVAEGPKDVTTEFGIVALMDAVQACDSLMTKTFRCFSDPDLHVTAVIAAHCNYPIESRMALVKLKTILDTLSEWNDSVRHHDAVLRPPTEVSDDLKLCAEALEQEVSTLTTSELNVLLHVEDISEFCKAKTIARREVDKAIPGIQELDERESIEPFLREILSDPLATPHTPTEIADIFTQQVTYGGKRHIAGFVIKGKSLKKVTAKSTTHQLTKLRQMPSLKLIVLLAVGTIQDDIRRDFFQIADDGNYDRMIIDASDVARIFVAYGKVCREHGIPLDDGRCPQCPP